MQTKSFPPSSFGAGNMPKFSYQKNKAPEKEKPPTRVVPRPKSDNKKVDSEVQVIVPEDDQIVGYHENRQGAQPVHKVSCFSKAFSQEKAARKIVCEECKVDGCTQGEKMYLLHNVLSPQECAAMVGVCAGLGFHADSEYGPTRAPKPNVNTRVVVEDYVVSNLLWERVKDTLPLIYKGATAVALNERFRVNKYVPGQRFVRHVDKPFIRNDNEYSQFTFLIYLNDTFEGGHTTFFEKPTHRKSRQELKLNYDLTPVPGTVVVFDHTLFHEGATVFAGIKYTCRLDVMFKKAL